MAKQHVQCDMAILADSNAAQVDICFDALCKPYSHLERRKGYAPAALSSSLYATMPSSVGFTRCFSFTAGFTTLKKRSFRYRRKLAGWSSGSPTYSSGEQHASEPGLAHQARWRRSVPKWNTTTLSHGTSSFSSASYRLNWLAPECTRDRVLYYVRET